MPTILISYDLKETPMDIHINVKKTMIAKFGYSERCGLKSENQLPNTCLIHLNKSVDQSVLDLEQVVKLYSGTLEKYISVVYTSGKCHQYI